MEYDKKKRQVNQDSIGEIAKLEVATSGSNIDQRREITEEKLDAAIQMEEFTFELDQPEDVLEGQEMMKFFLAKSNKDAPEIHDNLETIGGMTQG